jgi:hypothetical protein
MRFELTATDNPCGLCATAILVGRLSPLPTSQLNVTTANKAVDFVFIYSLKVSNVTFLLSDAEVSETKMQSLSDKVVKAVAPDISAGDTLAIVTASSAMPSVTIRPAVSRFSIVDRFAIV